MHLDTLKDIYKLDSHSLYKDQYLNKMALAYLTSDQQSEYKLYHQYLFRSDIWLNHIKENYNYDVITESDKLNITDPKIRKKLDEYSYIFVGYIKQKYAKKYSELFLSLHHLEGWRDFPEHYNICGYSVKNRDSKYDYLYENTIELGFKDILLPIEVESEIGKQLIKWSKKLK